MIASRSRSGGTAFPSSGGSALYAGFTVKWRSTATTNRDTFEAPLPISEFMKFEHFALNVPDARAQAAWYVKHLGFSVVRKREDEPFTHFLADDTGRVIVELYTNTAANIPDYAAAHPLTFHFAVVAQDTRAERARLEKAGATLFLEETLADASSLMMMRDPWGVPVQLCHRTRPF